jgi:cobalamin biosynthesis Co2+ chelatase CbiK
LEGYILKKIISSILILGLMFTMITGCTKKEEANVTSNETPAKTEEVKKAILAVSFGTSYADTRKVTIEATEKALSDAFPEYEVRRAFTSNIIIKKLKERDNIQVDTVVEAMDKLKSEGFNEVIVQPLHVIPGAEYNDVKEELRAYNDGTFDIFKLGRPILTTDEDYKLAVEGMKSQIKEDMGVVVLMGHGTHHPANASYGALQEAFVKEHMPVYVGTVEGYPTLDDVINRLKKDKATKVTLMPYMLVAGDHAQNDMAGDEEDSWKTVLKKEGFEIETYLHGLGENEEYRKIYINHAKEAIEGEGEIIPQPLNKVEMGTQEAGKKGILVVSFGTSYADTRKVTIEAVEEKIAKEFSDYQVKRAFTSNMIIKKLKERDGIMVDTPEEALNKMKEEGFEEVIVQPLHIMAGAEYDDLVEATRAYEDTFKKLVVGKSVLSGPVSYEKAANGLMTQVGKLEKGEAVVVMGHGTHHASNASYACLQNKFNDKGLPVYVGTVEAHPALEDVIAKLKKDNIKKVKLMPYMLVAGDHAQNDMAGDEEDSWKTVLKKEGFEVEIYLHGLGENKEYQNIYVENTKEAIAGEHE